MNKISDWIVKKRKLILVIGVLLLLPSVIGIQKTRINYDMLNYLPDSMETVKGQNILLDEFDKGAFSLIILKGMDVQQITDVKEKIEQIEHVSDVIWYDNLLDSNIPMDILPDKYKDVFNHDDETMIAVFFNTSTSADATMKAISDIREVTSQQCFVTGMSAMVTDLKQLCEQEEPIYVGIAVALSCLAMMLALDSWLIPILFLVSIGMAIVYNLGTNIFLGEISYITKALSAVLQLGVTMDYSIFLWHSYLEERAINTDHEQAMSRAISNTFTSVVGSSITTIAGFIALCFMSFTLGKDLGIVMAKGVLFGVIGCVTILPALILVFEKAIEKLRHKSLLPNMDFLANFVMKHRRIWLIVFIIICVPAYICNSKTQVYYDLGGTLPESMAYVQANTKLEEDFNMGATHMMLVNANLSSEAGHSLLSDLKKVDGVSFALGLDSVLGANVPVELIPDSFTKILKSEHYQLVLIGSQYKTATDEVNNQIDELNAIMKKYDSEGMLIGEAPCTKDMISVTNHDFQVVDTISILAIFIIIAIVLKSFGLPLLLVAVIELAIFINLGIPFITNTTLPFIAPICISTIQLGATVDYAILMTTRYKKNRLTMESSEAVNEALKSSIPSIIVSAFGFFCATFGVALYSNIAIINSLCMLMARGALISMVCVIFFLPTVLVSFDKFIVKTTKGMKG